MQSSRKQEKKAAAAHPGSADEKDFCSGKDGDAVEKAEHASKPSRSKQGFSREGRARKHEWSRELQLDTANRTEATRRPTEHQSITGNLRRTTTINAGSTAKNAKAFEERFERTGSSPRSFLKGRGSRRSTRTAGTISGARRTE
jgi:hypothetical protein